MNVAEQTAAAVDAYGPIESLKLVKIDVPPISDTQVLVRVRAAGVGIWDAMQRTGAFPVENAHFPMVLGLEFAGDVVAVGDKVERHLHEGDAVYAYFSGGQGAYAQFVAVNANAPGPRISASCATSGPTKRSITMPGPPPMRFARFTPAASTLHSTRSAARTRPIRFAPCGPADGSPNLPGRTSKRRT